MVEFKTEFIRIFMLALTFLLPALILASSTILVSAIVLRYRGLMYIGLAVVLLGATLGLYIMP